MLFGSLLYLGNFCFFSYIKNWIFPPLLICHRQSLLWSCLLWIWMPFFFWVNRCETHFSIYICNKKNTNGYRFNSPQNVILHTKSDLTCLSEPLPLESNHRPWQPRDISWKRCITAKKKKHHPICIKTQMMERSKERKR